ncbi:MAG TPA: HEAT repeat domain-containing protein, partial [Oculatellaceae cyanobacterium]
LEDCDHLNIEVNWQSEKQLLVRTEVRFLVELTAKDQSHGKLKDIHIKEALTHLEEFLEILEDDRTKTQGSPDWHFKLKLWSKDKAENLKRFEFEWKTRKEQKSKSKDKKVPPDSPDNPIGPIAGIDGWQVCHDMLEAQNQGRLTTNPLTTGDGVVFELDEIYVPLGLVERKQRDRRSGDVSPERGSQLYEPESQDEIIQTFQQDQFFEQVLRQGRSRRIAIIGEPGAGKTTLLQKIAAWVLDNTEDVPIWISLADVQGKTLEQYLLSDWLKAAIRKVHVTQKMEEDLGELFNSKRVWLLLDAVDEMTVGAQSLAPLQLIANQLTGWVADARVVLTCRLNVWDAGKNALEAFDTYRNLDFSYGDAQTPDQVGQFIRRWFKDNLTLAERLRTELDQPGKERIKDAVKNPLRLALLCRSWALAQGGLPNTKAGLYQQFTEALYEWKQDRFPTSSSQRQQLNKALGELAKKAIGSSKTKFRLRHHLVSSVLGKSDADLFQLALQLGWLNQVGVAAEAENRGEKVYAFYHPTFQEYFAAQAIDDWHFFLNHTSHNPAKGTYRVFESQWKEVILLWLGREDVPHEQKEELIKALVEFKDGCEEFFFDGYQYRGFYEYRAYFLAAAGIAEFVDCSRSDEIVAQLVKWSFGCFNFKKQQWQAFLDSIEKGARVTLLEKTERSRAIATLVQLLRSTEDETIRRLTVYSLRKIGTSNPIAIAALVQLLRSTEDEGTRRITVSSLGDIGSGSSQAIKALVQLLESTKNKYTLEQAVYSLGKVGIGNETAITALVQLIKSARDEDIRRLAAYSLGKVGIGNETAITASVQVIRAIENEYAYWQAANAGRSREIGFGNPETITALVQLLESTNDKETCLLAATNLGEIGTGNETAIAALVQLIRSTEDESIRRQVASSLGKIGTSNSSAIATLIQLLRSTEDESTRRRTADSLGKIDSGNSEAIKALVQLLESTKNESTLEQAVYSLGKIGSASPEAIKVLVRLLESTKNEYTRWQAASSLGKIDPGNSEAVKVLVQLLESTKNESIRRQAADNLKKIVRDDQLVGIITALKDYLSQESYENDRKRFDECYKVIWHCAQTMYYPAFYQAWHNQPTLTYPEVLETTTIGFNPSTQNPNLAELPQNLSPVIANDPTLSQSIHVIYIDGSKFIDRDNPALKIYTEMVKAGCPKCDDGTPKTMPELQIYWDLLESNKRVVLVFYESTLPLVPPLDKGRLGFSDTFLDALSKFDGAICVVTSPPASLLQGEGSKSISPSSLQGEGVGGWGSLQCFSSTQPQLVEDIVGWIRAIR